MVCFPQPIQSLGFTHTWHGQNITPTQPMHPSQKKVPDWAAEKSVNIIPVFGPAAKKKKSAIHNGSRNSNTKPCTPSKTWNIQLWESLQGGSLPVISGVITPFNGRKNPWISGVITRLVGVITAFLTYLVPAVMFNCSKVSAAFSFHPQPECQILDE